MWNDLAKPRILLALSLAFVTLAGTACSTAADGTPIPQTSDGRTEESRPSAPSTGAEVENPLDANRFLADPCATLTQTQLATFDVTRPGTPETTGAVAEESGPFCVWHAAVEIGSTIGVGFITGNKNGLSDIYRGREQFEDFRPVEVDKYPAVFANSPDLRSSGMCTVYVGISDTLAFRATEGGQLDAAGSCDRAKQVAAAALATIREAN